MNRRRFSLPNLEPNQPGITQFVERDQTKEEHPIKFISAWNKKQLSTPSLPKTSSTNSVSKKRTRPVLSSPDSSAERNPNKRKAINMENVNQTNHDNSNGSGSGDQDKLTPDLELLNKQLFAGFESMIEPLRKDIKQLKTERKHDEAALCVETVNRKFLRNEAKQK